MVSRSNLFKEPTRAKQKTSKRQTDDKPDTYFKQREAYLKGTSGPAGPCKRICPESGEVIEVLEPKPLVTRPRQPPGYEHYTPEMVDAIRSTCSTQADRAGMTQAEVFDARGTK